MSTFAQVMMIIFNSIKAQQMKKTLYEKPSMRVFELRQKPALLVGSATGDVNATMDEFFKEEPI